MSETQLRETQLQRLVKPFPDSVIKKNPAGGGNYVKHSVVNEKLLAVLGGFDFELFEIVRGFVPHVSPDPNGNSDRAKRGSPPLDNAIVGVVCRLTLTVDGATNSYMDASDCESPHNWPHDGARLKDAMSDALKRCAARAGVALHLWSQSTRLYDQLSSASSPTIPPTTEPGPRAAPVGPGSTPCADERLAALQARERQLELADIRVGPARAAHRLPALTDQISPEQLDQWEHLIVSLEHEREMLERPFEQADA